MCLSECEQVDYLDVEKCWLSQEESSEEEGADAMRFTRHETRIL